MSNDVCVAAKCDDARRFAVWRLAAALTLLALFAAWSFTRSAAAAEKLVPADVAQALSQAYADVAAAIGPSVVSISSEIKSEVQTGDLEEFGGGDGDDEEDGEALPPGMEELRRFFNMPGPYGMRPGPRGPNMRRMPAPPRTGMGSGVVIDAAGYILTNHHVVKGADKLTVRLPDETLANATVVGSDPETDLAVVKLTNYTGKLVAAKLGDSDEVAVGNIVIAIGAPFSQIHSFTSGIVSGKSRRLGAVSYENYIQTDAAINPGNSGGPLVNLKAEVIGINTIISTRSGASAGVGFAVPSNLVKTVVKQLIAKGRVTRGWLGIEMSSLDQVMRTALGNPEGGVHINKPLDGGPAKKAGIERGDVLLTFNGKPIKDSNDLLMMVAEVEPGTVVKVDLLRNGERKTVSITLDKRPDSASLASNGVPSEPDDARRPAEGPAPTAKSERLGLTVRETRPGDERGGENGKAYDGEKGVIVTSVVKNGPAHEAGLIPRVMIIQLGSANVPTLEAFKKAEAALGDAGAVRALVCLPSGEATYIALELGKKP